MERLRDLQVKKFKKILEWAYKRSKFHRRLYQEAGLGPGDIKSVEDVAKAIKKTAPELRGLSGGIPIVDRNVEILASVKILEINISDLLTYKV